MSPLSSTKVLGHVLHFHALFLWKPKKLGRQSDQTGGRNVPSPDTLSDPLIDGVGGVAELSAETPREKSGLYLKFLGM
jgi:hypothetical protein